MVYCRGCRWELASVLRGEGIDGSGDCPRWGVVAPTQDKLRHVALDVTAAVIAGHGRRERSVTPSARVYTFAEKNKAPHVTATLERGAMFVLLSDTEMNGRYEALIYMAKVGQVSLPPSRRSLVCRPNDSLSKSCPGSNWRGSSEILSEGTVRPCSS